MCIRDRNDRYLNEKEKDHYADYLESEEAPQYEIDTQRKMARQRFTVSYTHLSYYVKELSTNSAYVLNEQKYPVHFEYAGQDTAIVHLLSLIHI